MLSPECSTDTHEIVEEVLKGIIAMATPPPADSISTTIVSNRFARDLASKDCVSRLTSYMLLKFTPDDPSFANSVSTVSCSTSVVIELIRKNNSDYFEPYMFHTVRNRLLQVQQEHQSSNDDDGDEKGEESSQEMLESVMDELISGMGVVNLSPVLEEMCTHLSTLVGYLRNPRSSVSATLHLLT